MRVKPFKYGVVVATCFSYLQADQLATDSRLKGLFAFGRQATTAKTVKSPVAKKDVSPQTPVGILNLIEVSDNFYWCVG
jgi:hypothetical protein